MSAIEFFTTPRVSFEAVARSSVQVVLIVKSLLRSLPILVALAAVGCAKFPTNSVARTTRIVFTMTTDGDLRPDFVYRIAMNFTPEAPPTTTGPEPVVRSPWGNGYVAGTVTNFVDWNPNRYPPSGFGLYEFRGGDLNTPVQIGVPVLADVVQAGGRTLRFTLDVSQLGLTLAQITALKYVQVNFLTMDRIPTGTDPGTKFWDALGDSTTVSGIDGWVDVPIYISGSYSNVQGINNQGIEPRGDVADPSLDIISWSIDVQVP